MIHMNPREQRASARNNRPGILRRFLHDSSAATAIEFGMIAVPFLGIMGAIFETGSIYFKTAQLQLATETASRVLLTHSLSSTPTNQQFINNHVCTWQAQSGVVKPGTLSTMFDCSKLMIQVTNMNGVWSTVNGSGSDIYNNPPAQNAALTVPAPGQIAVVRIVYPMPSVFSILGAGIGSIQASGGGGYVLWGGKPVYMLVGMAAFRVEP